MLSGLYLFIYFRTRKIPGTGSWRHKFPCLTHSPWRNQTLWYEVQDLCHTAEYYVGNRNAGEELFVCLISSSVNLIKLNVFMAHLSLWTETFKSYLTYFGTPIYVWRFPVWVPMGEMTSCRKEQGCYAYCFQNTGICFMDFPCTNCEIQ